MSQTCFETFDEVGDDECLSKFCFISIEEEEKDDDIRKAFDELYMEFISITKKRKEMKIKLEAITMENEQLK